MKYYLVAIILLLSYVLPTRAQSSKKANADSVLLDPIIKKANASLGNTKVVDSLTDYAFGKAKTLKNNDYAGRAASVRFASVALTDINKAMPWYDTSMVYLNKVKNYLWIGYNNNNLGLQLCRKYKFETGISYLIKGSKNFETARDTAMVGYAYICISNAFHDFGNYDSGKKYAKMAIAILQTTKKSTPELRWRSMTVLAINYDDNKEYDKALNVNFKNLKNATGNHLFLGSNYNNIGNTYLKIGEYQKSYKYLLLSLKEKIKTPDDYRLSSAYSNLANVKMELGDLKLARSFIDSAMYHSKKSGSPEKIMDTYENFSKLGVKSGNYKIAFDYFKLRADLRDSLINVTKTKIVYDLQIQYETEKKDKENQQLKYQSNLRAVARDKAESDKRFIIYVALIAVVALCVIFALIYRNTIVKNRFAEEQKLNKALLDGEQNERIRIARDLHDSIGQMMSVIKMNLSNLNHKYPADNQIDSTLVLVDRTITEVRHISHNLIPEELNFGLFAALEDMFDKINAGDGTKINFNIPDEVRDHSFERSNELTIYRIVQEAVGNIVKHAQATQIDIYVLRRADQLTIAIKDNGSGFDIGQIKNSTGIGWKNIAARVNLLDGNLNVQSEKLSGTQIEITIPDDK
ncbi:tetratricopeptide repeat-containing sensor histidine kinase [Mucilaginibacter myungsuensis]|uniref:histidine kinase n=1 Tax=Mucilaginibacter myungsuensis TaxID=649104 RepID=A0A929KSM6_9SPHI|nr:sensor histidine kinase [Mucilaginibacter myungsuensis]MBE9660417.1 sensor histidine kinase [Mucilaginibacter myungsuensis]MDN3600459.1 sensor histidine kinase [Mucilaginibacter myungsuensis]